MAMHIYPREIRGKVYYYAQRSRREKIDPARKGKTKGSGKSRVRSDTVYLGSAESIVERLRRPGGP